MKESTATKSSNLAAQMMGRVVIDFINLLEYLLFNFECVHIICAILK